MFYQRRQRLLIQLEHAIDHLTFKRKEVDSCHLPERAALLDETIGRLHALVMLARAAPCYVVPWLTRVASTSLKYHLTRCAVVNQDETDGSH